MFKDEAGGKQIVEFDGLRAKLYFCQILDGSEDKICKVVTKNVTKRSIRIPRVLVYLAGRNNVEK